MFFYLLDSNFRRFAVIDDFVSAIWTERYIKSGEVNLVVEPTAQMIDLLREATRIQINGSKEVMLIETVLNEEGLLKVNGTSLLQFLNSRVSWTIEKVDHGPLILFFSPIGAIRDRLNHTIIYNENTVLMPLDRITNLTLDDDAPEYDTEQVVVEFGQLYEKIQELAERYAVGLSLYLDSADDSGYSLKFKTYRGADRTSSQSTYPVIRFSPKMGSLSNPKELRSIAGYKNVAYAIDTNGVVEMQTVYAPEIVDGETLTDFDRRSMMVFVSDEIPEGQGEFTLQQAAKNALINNNYIRIVDGEVSPLAQYKFGIDYFMGDVIELEGPSGLLQKVRVTEHIRAKDNTGERAYPTIEIIDPNSPTI